MENLIQLRIQLTFIIFLFLYTSPFLGQTPINNSSSEGFKLNSTNSFYKTIETGLSMDNNIRSIYQDKNDHYWFGTNGAGVFRYDKKTLKQYTVNEGLADNQVLTIQENELGELWIGTGLFGISKFDGNRFITQPKTTPTHGSNWKSKNNDLWFNAGDGVFRENNSSIYYLPFNSSGKDPFTLSRYSVYFILKDKKGNVWFGTQAEGVCKFDGKTLTWFKEKGLAGPAVLGIFEDSKGTLWFGNNGAGLFRFDGETLTNFTEEMGLNNDDFIATGEPKLGTLARVYTINEDDTGNIWIGTVDAGIWKYNGEKLTNYTTDNGLTSNSVNTIYKDNLGELWFGTDSNGICKFNGTEFYEFIIK